MSENIYCFLSSPDRVRKHLHSYFQAIGNNFAVQSFRGLSPEDLIFYEKEKLFLQICLKVFNKIVWNYWIGQLKDFKWTLWITCVTLESLNEPCHGNINLENRNALPLAFSFIRTVDLCGETLIFIHDEDDDDDNGVDDHNNDDDNDVTSTTKVLRIADRFYDGKRRSCLVISVRSPLTTINSQRTK